MEAPRLSLRHLLAGLEAGVLGTFLMLACVMLGAITNGRSAWVFPNLMATLFVGRDAYRNEYLNTSLAGVAILVLIYGVLGVVWGMLVRERNRPGLTVLGAIVGVAVYYLFFHLIWPQAAPMIPIYAPDRQLELGHLLWGGALARSPVFARRIAGQEVVPTAPEVGEVIL